MREMGKMVEADKYSINCDLMNLSVVWVREADSDTKWNMKSHFHTHYELHVALSGKCILKIKDEDIYLESGNYILIPPRIDHLFKSISADYREFVAGFYMEFTDLCEEGNVIRNALMSMDSVYPLRYDACFEQYIKDCMRFKKNRIFVSGVAINMCLMLLEIAKQVMQETGRKKLEINEKGFVDEVKLFITSNLAGGVDTKSVAAHFNISERHLNRLLKTKLQKSVNDLIMEERISCIKKYLKTTDMTLEHIAELVGFTNSYNMSRAFKQQEGLPPGEYRKALRKQ